MNSVTLEWMATQFKLKLRRISTVNQNVLHFEWIMFGLLQVRIGMFIPLLQLRPWEEIPAWDLQGLPDWNAQGLRNWSTLRYGKVLGIHQILQVSIVVWYSSQDLNNGLSPMGKPVVSIVPFPFFFIQKCPMEYAPISPSPPPKNCQYDEIMFN